MMKCTYVHVKSYLMNISVRNKKAFVYDSHFKPLHQSKCCGALIYNRSDSPICVLKDKDRETNKNLGHSLKHFLVGQCTVEYVYKITPC